MQTKIKFLTLIGLDDQQIDDLTVIYNNSNLVHEMSQGNSIQTCNEVTDNCERFTHGK